MRAEDRGDFEATMRAKANATGADLAEDPEDAAWLGALLTHAREGAASLRGRHRREAHARDAVRLGRGGGRGGVTAEMNE